MRKYKINSYARSPGGFADAEIPNNEEFGNDAS
jgi:hypothetical protein